jgi:prepilin-type N-terminal cleavage/methylation domain-containing protein
MRQRVNGERGVTLIELLVVLIIIGVLGAVTLRAMDMTRERANYDKTMKTIERLAQAIVGDPNLVAEGRRTDFGFVGDLGRLPVNFEELRTQLTGDSAWNGPYVRVPFQGDVESYKTDAWGQELQYLPEQATIFSLANGRVPITYRIFEDPAFLFQNRVSGTITDDEGNPPGDQAPNLRVSVWVVDSATGRQARSDTVPGQDGSYTFAPPRFRIPVGNHQMLVVRGGGTNESLTKWVTVSPRVGAIVDFRLSSKLSGALRVINNTITAYGDSSASVAFEVINTSSGVIGLDSIAFFRSPPIYCESLRIHHDLRWGWVGVRRAGENDVMLFSARDSVASMARMLVELKVFRYSPTIANDSLVPMHGRNLQLRFSDGSLVNFLIP